MKKRKVLEGFLASVVLASTSIVLCACDKAEPQAIVSIQSVTLSVDEPLIAGQRIKFGVNARVQGVSKPSLLGLVVQSDRSLIGYTEPVPVANEKTVRLEVEIVVPESPSMELITPLYVNGAERTNILDIRHFKIVGKQG